MSTQTLNHLVHTPVVGIVDEVAKLIPPLWDLTDYVAVNPFLGYAATPLPRAAEQINNALGAHILPPFAYFQRRLREGLFDVADAERAATQQDLDPSMVASVLTGKMKMPTRQAGNCPTFTDRYDDTHGRFLGPAMLRWVTRWCAVYVNGANTAWQMPVRTLGLFASWREAAEADRTPEIAGLRGWRRWVMRLPQNSGEALEQLLRDLPLEAADYAPYFYQLLGRAFGWASYLRRTSWQNGDTRAGDVLDLLTILVCTDAGVFHLLPKTPERPLALGLRVVEDESVRFVLQEATEDGYVRRLLAGGITRPVRAENPARPAIQAAFCIDVRSEPIRRHLEAQHPGIRTIGFAGFFGVALAWEECGEPSARCPVLLKPAVAARAKVASKESPDFKAAKHLATAPGAAFSFMELAGWAYGFGLLRRSIPAPATPTNYEHVAPFQVDALAHGMTSQWKADLAQGILKNMGLRRGLARLVVLCGHAGQSVNNPHAAGLDCGACGGHGGAINARVAASLLNDPDVRRALADREQSVPEDTWFVPAEHDTTVDQVVLFDAMTPSTHAADIKHLKAWLAAAGKATRRERAARLGLSTDQSDEELEAELRCRAGDWSQVRPEWALARNAAFIAARRERTRGINLDGRAFLHDYDAATDPDGSVLTLILTAPAVVASWINLQYLASTVDNRAFGCGDKALHNRVGLAGVVLGNGGDLRTGLPLQSVNSAYDAWFHDPLRLQIIVEAPEGAIDKVLAAHVHTRDLVENGWVRLFALDPNGTAIARRLPGGRWEPVKSGADGLP